MTADEKFDQFLQRAARHYNAPPATPRADMWARIDAARRSERPADVVPLAPRRSPRAVRWLVLAAGMAAMLLIGVVLGRRSTIVPPMPGGTTLGDDSTAASMNAAAAALPYRLAAIQHFGQTEALLTTVRSGARTGRMDAQVARWSRDLLANTQLLLDSPAGDDPQLKRLLGDLELVLTQIARLPATAGARDTADIDLIEQAISHHDLLTRIRTTIPAGRGPVGS